MGEGTRAPLILAPSARGPDEEPRAARPEKFHPQAVSTSPAVVTAVRSGRWGVVIALLVVVSLLGSAGLVETSRPAAGSPVHPIGPTQAPRLPAVTPGIATTFPDRPIPLPTVPTSTSPGLELPGGRMAETVAAIRAAGVPLRYAFLPDLDRSSGSSGPGALVSPTYSSAPAPLGVADFGVINRSGTLVASDLSTSRLEGVFDPTAFAGLAMDVGGPDFYGVQLNAVLQDVTLFGQSDYSFWTQNVAEYSTSAHELQLLDNIWNFSSSTGALSLNAIYSHGSNGTQVGTTYYYALGPLIHVGYPFRLTLFLNSTVLGNRDVVYFNYTVSNATLSRAGSYDEVEFSSTPSSGTTPLPQYVADGSNLNALGLPNDFEMVVGGPGGGSNFDAFNASAAIDLYDWAGSSFQVVPSAYDVGGDTGETAAGLASTWTPTSDLAIAGPPGPAAHLGQGPALLGGEWNVTNTSQGASILRLGVAPSNAFAFVAPGLAPNMSSYQWAPPAGEYTLPPAEYSVTVLASEFRPTSVAVGVGSGTTWLNVTLIADPATGVYTPLWALSEGALGNISSSCVAGECTLWNDEAGSLGAPGGSATSYPWFGTFNDFFYPEFAGLLLWNVSGVRVASPPSFEAATPPAEAGEALRYGTPPVNDLPLFCYDDRGIQITGGAAIGGWWFTGSYLGPVAAQTSLVLWNTSASLVANNSFLTSAGGIFLYGGTNNSVEGNTFLNYVPLAPNEASIAGAVVGTTGLYEADFGNGGAGSSGCACSDLVYNNAFGTYFTAVEPKADPYTGGTPRFPFDARWNITPTPGPNIAGGSELGGNFWWNYGASVDPYWVLPYNASGAIHVGGDPHPLLPAPLWTVTFDETGLPSGTAWEVGFDTSTGFAYNSTTGTSLTESWPSGVYFVIASSLSGEYGLPTTIVLQLGAQNTTELLHLYRLYSLAFATIGLPPGGFWTVTVWNPFGSWLDLGNVPAFPAEYLATATYNFTVTSPPGFAASPAAGTVDLVANTTVVITLSNTTAPAGIVGSVRPATGVSLWVDGQPVLIGTGGSFAVNVSPGVHSVEATAPGYAPYFNNVTARGGAMTSLSIVLTALSSSGPLSPADWELLLAVVSAAAVALAGTTLVFYRRARRPPSSARPGPP
jgi:thermopsin